MKKMLVLAGVIFFVPSLVDAGDISKRSYSRYFEWESSDCYQPSAPYIYELDEYNKWEAENYIDDVETYINCVESEAQDDYSDAIKKLASAIEEGRDETIDEAKSELNNFISSLE